MRVRVCASMCVFTYLYTSPPNLDVKCHVTCKVQAL